MTRIIAVSGYKNSGKTTLCRKLLAELQKLGIRTGYIKRTSEAAISKTDNDTGSVMDMGIGSLLWGDDGLRYESPAGKEITPQAIAAKYFPEAELIILEGGKNLNLPKIWVRSEGEEIPDYPGIFLVYDRCGNTVSEKTYTEGHEAELALRLSALVRGPAYRSCRVYIGDDPLPMKDFVADFIRGGIMGMLESLKGGTADPGVPVRVYLDGNTENKQ